MWLRYEPLSARIDCPTPANEHGKEIFDAVATVLAYPAQAVEFVSWRRYKPQLRFLSLTKFR